MQDFAVIPVIDLKGGSVVHARAGMRERYRPLASPHGPAHDPLTIARALLAITGSPILYIADLDAIEGTGDHFEICRELANALPNIALWIDAGFNEISSCLFWLPIGATLVVGSEGLASADSLVRAQRRAGLECRAVARFRARRISRAGAFARSPLAVARAASSS